MGVKKIRMYKYDTNLNEFCKLWLILTSSLHNLSKSEINVLAELIASYYKYEGTIADETLRWDAVFHNKNKSRIRDVVGIGQASFQNILTSLRKKKILVDGQISKVYIPYIGEKGDRGFRLVQQFNIKDETDE